VILGDKRLYEYAPSVNGAETNLHHYRGGGDDPAIRKILLWHGVTPACSGNGRNAMIFRRRRLAGKRFSRKHAKRTKKGPAFAEPLLTNR
jgi:hypothetical protein